MSHIRYIKKNGKTYGPYTYNSIRTKEGKVKNVYLGKPKNTLQSSVVQKIIFASFALLAISLLLFLNTNQASTGMVILENGLGKQISEYELEKTEQGYNARVGDNIGTPNSAVIENIKNFPEKINTKTGCFEDNRIRTEVFAVKEELEFDKAVLKLEKTGEVSHILYCPNFDFENFDCDSWEKTDTPFTDFGNYIGFEVKHFTAYAGGGDGGEASNLTVWDDTDQEGGSNLRYSEGCQIPFGCSSKVQTSFFANYTNVTGTELDHPINTSSSNCSISLHINLTSDDEASWTTPENMTFTMARDQYEYNSSFNYRGVFYYNVSCWDDNYDDNSTLDTFLISNSEPYVVQDPLPDFTCNEDQWCYLNFSYNCTDPDLNDADRLSYSINDTTFSCMWFDTSTGNLSIYCTNESTIFTGDFFLTVTDSVASDSSNIRITVSAVNDAPVFSTIAEQDIYEDTSYQINLSSYYSDEENDAPYFIENNTEAGSPLFINISYNLDPPYAFNGEIINATPSNSEVGNYSLNITVNDTAGSIASQVVVFEVINVNDLPSLEWVCTDNDTNFTLTEDELFTCAVNATDDDFIWGDNLTYTANESWFTFLGQSNNESNVSFTPTDEQVGFWWINITVTDTGDATDSKLVNITVLNISDAPVLAEIGNFTAYVDVPYTFSINATDEDLLIPGEGESLNFTINDTALFTLGDAYVSDSIVYSDISFTPSSAGDYWINFSVNDTDGFTVSQLVNISIRGNSIPILSATVDNNATEDVEFYVNLTDNATDADGDAIAWSDNTTLFDIDPATGEINFTANDSYVGENWVNVTITDAPGSNNSQAINFTVYNVEDLPNFTEPIGNHTVYEDTEFYLIINATDEDLYIPEGNIFGLSENLTFAVNDTSLFNIVKDNETNATINFTAVNDSQAGLYWFEINVSDTTGLVFNETINITILAVNDVPQFVDFANITSQQSIPVYYDFNASDEENGTDTIEGDGNLTFWISNITNATDGDMINGIMLTPQFFDDAAELLNSTTGILSFTPNSTHAGTGVGYRDYLINLSVNDSDGAIASEIINLSIKNENDPPVLNCNLLTASGFSNQESVTMYENDTNMTLTVTNVKDDDGDTLTFTWTLDNVVNESEAKATSLSGSDWVAADTWNYYPWFNDSGEHNLTLLVSDGINESVDSGGSYAACYRNVTVLDVNSPPQFILTIQNITFNQGTRYTNLDLDDHFSDIENQTGLNFTFDQFDENLNSISNSSITVEVSSATHVVTFTPASSWYGLEYVQFHANDSTDTASSNTFFLNVTQAEVTAVTTTSTSGGGGGGGVRKILVTIDIIHPGALTIYKGDMVVSPIILRNSNADITLRDIDIEARAPGKLNLKLSETHIDQLAPQEEKEIKLTITGISEGFEEITVKAIVHNPEVTDSVKIFATILGMPTAIEEKIKFVKDLFKENPECLELNELIARAEQDIAAGQYEAALDKINTAIDKCKDLISVVYKTPETEIKKKISIKNVILLSLLNIVSLAFILFTIKKLTKRKEAD